MQVGLADISPNQFFNADSLTEFMPPPPPPPHYHIPHNSVQSQTSKFVRPLEFSTGSFGSWYGCSDSWKYSAFARSTWQRWNLVAKVTGKFENGHTGSASENWLQGSGSVPMHYGQRETRRWCWWTCMLATFSLSENETTENSFGPGGCQGPSQVRCKQWRGWAPLPPPSFPLPPPCSPKVCHIPKKRLETPQTH